MTLSILDPVGLAYIAGFFDGEGSIVITSRGHGRLDLDVVVVNTDRDVVEMIRATFGTGNIYRRSRAGSLGKKPAFVLQWAGKRAEEVLRLLYPYLRIKKGKAEIALRFRETFTRRHCGAGLPESVQRDREALRAEISERHRPTTA